ncbi:MAG: hypothetical protein JXJ04_03770 [Spirochaetales bacterium]|nr:hypothetical protein [Spirochaetales bacterium]
MFKGLLLKESLTSEKVLDLITITKTEIWENEGGSPPQPEKWTALSFEGPRHKADIFADELAKVMKPEWYANFSTESDVYVIFENRVFNYPKGNEMMLEMVREYAISKGIPQNQIDWKE